MSRRARPPGARTVAAAQPSPSTGDYVPVKIGPGECYVTKTDEMIVTVLGSCISACIRDTVARVGGMNHFMLPESATGVWGPASAHLRFGNFAMEGLINDILRRGGQRRLLEIKIFGGADMHGSGMSVGRRNSEFILAYLRAEGFPVTAQHLRGCHPRRVHYFPATGRVLMQEMPLADRAVTKEEAGYAARLRGEQTAGSMELFD